MLKTERKIDSSCRIVSAYLVLDEKLDTLDGSSSSLGDSGGNTTHYDGG